MRRYWIVVLVAVLMTAVGLLSPIGQSASAQEAGSAMKLAFVPGGTLDGALPPMAEPAQELCGIGLGGRCPRGYRGCLRNQPKAVCEEWLGRCEACTHAMSECRQKVGHVAGFTCVKCRAAYSKCEAALQVPSK